MVREWHCAEVELVAGSSASMSMEIPRRPTVLVAVPRQEKDVEISITPYDVKEPAPQSAPAEADTPCLVAFTAVGVGRHVVTVDGERGRRSVVIEVGADDEAVFVDGRTKP